MRFHEDVHNTSLTLSLGSHEDDDDDDDDHIHAHHHLHQNKKRPSRASRMMMMICEDTHHPSLSLALRPLELVKRDVSDDDDHEEEFCTRKKLRLSRDQSVVLEHSFKQHTTLNSKQKHDLARRLILSPRQVEVWFQNRRARTKIKQTEVDYELLKKCFEALKDENKRLQREVEELKRFECNQTCPSCMCERSSYGGLAVDDGSAKSSLSTTTRQKTSY
ncbi:hypothetical protein DM860_006662 [Cuscuta australis]|uniref:Homeobox domain-containing protein n=1 Tax=Cuscuta australis TaxID=267555 RepID=A0A328D464_9ASTE|nr:hypothetical protein DM860_006662 [Cuscuta australis]